MTKAELLEKIRAGRLELDATLARFSPEQLESAVLPNGWTPKDVLAHLAWWEASIRKVFSALLQGEHPSGGDSASIDELNARIYAENRNRPLVDVRSEERQAYLMLLALVESASEDDLFNPTRFAWTGGRPFVEWVTGDSYEHYEEHLPELRAVLQK